MTASITRPDEQYVKKCLLEYLGSGASAESGENPPDYYFTIHGNKIAVEITGLYPVSFDSDGKAKNRTTEDQFSINICEELNRLLAPIFKPGCGVILTIYGPILWPRKFTKELREVVCECVQNAKIKERRSVMVAGNKVVLSLVKRNSEKNISALIVNSDASHDIGLNAEIILMDSIKRKTAIMSKIGWEGKKWLVLLNVYWLASPDTYQSIIRQITEEHCFERIYLVSQEGTVHLLHPSP